MIIIKPNKDNIPLEKLVFYDSQDVVEFLLARDVVDRMIQAEGSRITYFFIMTEVDPHKEDLMSSRPIMMDYQKLLAARGAWKRTLIMAKSQMAFNHGSD